MLRCSKSLGILYRARKILGQDTLRQLYFSFLYPYLSYCITIWGNAPASTLDPIFKLQKRAVRIVYNIKYRDSTKMACKKAKLLRLPELYTFSILIFMYKFKNNLLPEIFNTFYVENSSYHNYPTRHAKNLRNPRVRTKLATTFVKNIGVTIWNKYSTMLSHEMKNRAIKKTSN